MSERIDLNAVRAEALARVERGERNFKLAFFGALVFEALFLVVFLLAADFSNRTHVLLLIATVGGYTVVVLGLVVLGAHVSRGVARILKAVELLKG
ncbi:MAG TPA: hypothetical protein VNZ44_12620 [Pyrinomonadaceae bacterium]|nr:hypothetical protein [Pyrinomonadaceae bacterium]